MRFAVLLFLASFVAAACGAVGTAPTPTVSAPVGGYPGWPPAARSEVIPIPVSSELVVGDNRMLVNLIGSANEPLVDPARAVELRLYDLVVDPATPTATTQAQHTATIEGQPGLYRAQVSFGRPGEWGLEAVVTEPDGTTRIGRTVFPVREAGTTPPIGADAPASDTPTAATEADITQISTDDDPDPDFYRQSVAGALDADEPFALVFSTPAFCATAQCGPTLDIVKTAAADYKGRMSFIHVEPYRLHSVEGQLQPELSAENRPIPIDAVNEWGLPTEPYVFVVDADGKVAAKFEGIASAEELRAAFDAVAQ
jgi:hypothetical protein